MPINLGILGFAHGHVQAYTNAWQNQPELGVRIVRGWDHDRNRLDAALAKHGGTPADSAADLLACKEVQAVLITAETALHAELVEQAAAAGKAIILQKPMALTMAEADRIVAAVNRTGVPFTLAWQMRVDPQNIKMRELIQSGTIGRVFMLRRRHGLSVCLQDSFADSWHMSPKWNRDIWADDAAHPIDFIYWFLGLPETVTAEVVSLHNPRMPMDNGIAIFRYANGPLAEVSCSFTNHAAENTTEIIGEHGSIIQNYGDVPSCNVPHPTECGLKWYLPAEKKWTCSEIPTPANHGERLAALAGPLADFLHGGPPIASAEDGRNTLRMLLATYVSRADGRRVAINDKAIQNI